MAGAATSSGCAAEPGDDLFSQLVTPRTDGVSLTDVELRSTAGLVLAAGFETTVNLLGNGIALLASNPEQRRLLAERATTSGPTRSTRCCGSTRRCCSPDA